MSKDKNLRMLLCCYIIISLGILVMVYGALDSEILEHTEEVRDGNGWRTITIKAEPPGISISDFGVLLLIVGGLGAVPSVLILLVDETEAEPTT